MKITLQNIAQVQRKPHAQRPGNIKINKIGLVGAYVIQFRLLLVGRKGLILLLHGGRVGLRFLLAFEGRGNGNTAVSEPAGAALRPEQLVYICLLYTSRCV